MRYSSAKSIGSSKTQQIGQAAEELACQYLQKQGLKILERNYRCRMGEIDLIMQDDEDLIFIEVRYRQNNHYGNGAETVTLAKQNKVIKAANYYLQKQKFNDRIACRFDVVALTFSDQVEWIKNAFSA